ncbi:hypothetical protein [Rhodococcus sp. ARC_M5]|uniref:hypothetical protein n=1 Tax=Rhodococcus sp. ARC_M5 TaxID=2928851 RepID=UPI001FB39BFE|nr:hypothetical protein [Rhodococcus sp. ARC_M5]MCJ0894424.1 hypothetical protein [Rhodococcus sp. ARC_M5]
MTQPVPLQPPTVIGPDEAISYLERMDISLTDITEAIEAGEVAAGNVTNYYPVTAAGLSRWMTVVALLRERLADGGKWSPQNPQNRPISKHTNKQYTLSTVGGDDVTGIADHPRGPNAARRKGRSTAEAVNGTASLITVQALRGDTGALDSSAPPSGNWFLIYHRAEGSIRREISLPLGFDESLGQFTGWRVRVILPSWEPQNIPGKKPLDVGGQDVDFRVVEAG